MRGNPLDLSKKLYLTTTINNLSYVYCYNTSNNSFGSITPTAGFMQITHSYNNYSPVEFTVTNIGNGLFSMFDGSHYLWVNDENMFDLIVDTQNNIIFRKPEDSEYNIYDIQKEIYPSIPFNLRIDNENTNTRFYFFNNSEDDWERYTVTKESNNPFFIPVNKGQVSVWKTYEGEIDGNCYFNTTDKMIPIGWLYDWVNGTSLNCDKEGFLDSTYNNCYFSDAHSCETKWTYGLCKTQNDIKDICGTCMGSVLTNDNSCYYNKIDSYPPLFDNSEEIVDSEELRIELQPSDIINNNDNEDDFDGCSSTTGIAVILVVIIFFVIIAVVIYFSTRKTDHKSKNKAIIQNEMEPIYQPGQNEFGQVDTHNYNNDPNYQRIM